MPRAPKVALLIETSNAYARGLLAGVEEYIRNHGPWSVYLAEHGRGDLPPKWLQGWDGDGILARVENPHIAAVLATAKQPVDRDATRQRIAAVMESQIAEEADELAGTALIPDEQWDAWDVKGTYTGIADKRTKIADLLSDHGLRPEETVFIGDMEHDIETARHGGVLHGVRPRLCGARGRRGQPAPLPRE